MRDVTFKYANNLLNPPKPVPINSGSWFRKLLHITLNIFSPGINKECIVYITDFGIT